MRVLVTGHNGYIGPALTAMLQDAGHDVVGLDTNFFEDCAFDGELPQVSALRQDIRDVTVKDLAGFDAVAHLAALSNDPLGSLNERLTLEINYLASVQLARVAKDAGIKRFVFSSSCSVYGAGGEDVVDESSAIRPLTAYAASKARAEDGIAELADHAFAPVFLRSGTAYGLSTRLRLDVVLNAMAFTGVTRGAVSIQSGGTQWRPLVHISDIARAFVAALEAPHDQVCGQVFNVGANNENYQVCEIARLVAAEIPRCRVEGDTAFSGPDARSYRVDFSKISRQLPSFRTAWRAAGGAQELCSAFGLLAAMDSRSADAHRERYMRLAQLQKLRRRGAVDASLRWQRAAGQVVGFDPAERRVA
jgi:nucleoside-diphosphate-sugar epimerase